MRQGKILRTVKNLWITLQTFLFMTHIKSNILLLNPIKGTSFCVTAVHRYNVQNPKAGMTI
jgi:hypothetical protein